MNRSAGIWDRGAAISGIPGAIVSLVASAEAQLRVKGRSTELDELAVDFGVLGQAWAGHLLKHGRSPTGPQLAAAWSTEQCARFRATAVSVADALLSDEEFRQKLASAAPIHRDLDQVAAGFRVPSAQEVVDLLSTLPGSPASGPSGPVGSITGSLGGLGASTILAAAQPAGHLGGLRGQADSGSGEGGPLESLQEREDWFNDTVYLPGVWGYVFAGVWVIGFSLLLVYLAPSIVAWILGKYPFASVFWTKLGVWVAVGVLLYIALRYTVIAAAAVVEAVAGGGGGDDGPGATMGSIVDAVVGLLGALLGLLGKGDESEDAEGASGLGAVFGGSVIWDHGQGENLPPWVQLFAVHIAYNTAQWEWSQTGAAQSGYP